MMAITAPVVLATLPASPAGAAGVAGVAAPRAAAQASAAGLAVSVAYAEDKEINTPDPTAFPVQWAGSPGTIFLGGTVPGQTACGTLTV